MLIDIIIVCEGTLSQFTTAEFDLVAPIWLKIHSAQYGNLLGFILPVIARRY